MKVEIYSDVACPWCYVGTRRFERALAEFAGRREVEVVFRPFQLDPAAPAEATPLMPTLERKFGPRFRTATAPLVAAAKEEGIAIDLERALAVNTFLAHRLLRLAEREFGAAAQRDLAERLFEAYFGNGGDVGDRETLASLAASAGLDRERAVGFLASDEDERGLRAALEEARALGVDAVPTFVFDGRYAVSGAQPSALFAQVLERVASESAAATVHD